MSSTLRTTSALSKSLALALSEILYERCFYVFHAATPSVEQLLKKLVQNAAIQTSSFEFLKEFEALAKHFAVVTPKMNGSEIHGNFASHSRSLTSYENQESSSSPISNKFLINTSTPALDGVIVQQCACLAIADGDCHRRATRADIHRGQIIAHVTRTIPTAFSIT